MYDQPLTNTHHVIDAPEVNVISVQRSHASNVAEVEALFPHRKQEISLTDTLRSPSEECLDDITQHDKERTPPTTHNPPTMGASLQKVFLLLPYLF